MTNRSHTSKASPTKGGKIFSLTNELNNKPPEEIYYAIAEKERFENPKVREFEFKIRKDKDRAEWKRQERIRLAKEERERLRLRAIRKEQMKAEYEEKRKTFTIEEL